MQEKQKKWILRIALYLIGIMVLALGITLNTKTNLGVSPIISMPYAVAQIFGYETGTAVFVAYLIFIVLQIVLLKGKFPPFQFLQVAASYLTSAFITIFDRIIPTPDQMGMRLLVLALAIILTGIGAAVTVDVNIVPNPADGLARNKSCCQTRADRKREETYESVQKNHERRGICREIDSCAVHDPDCCAYGRKCPVP